MVIMFIVAIAIDFGRADLEHQRIQRAADAAALAASHRLGMADQDTSGPEAAERFFKANTDNREGHELEGVLLDPVKGEVKVFAGGVVGTSFLSAVGIRSLTLRAASRVVKGDGMVEVALVLDNSGSMVGQPISDLTTAASSLVGVVFSGSDGTDRVKVAVVPFSGAVNVGPENANAAWLDAAGASPLNGANFASDVPRLEMFNRVGVSWKGCVEARASGYDVTDTVASAGNPATLFVPMFAPDEPDGNNDAGKSYANNYLADDGGACSPQPTVCTSYNRRGQCTNWQKAALPPAEAQARICKYDGGHISSGLAGPNYMCDSEPLLPLTDDKSSVEAKLATLVAKGSTNIAEGVAWGWRTLSPAEPFSEGRPYETKDNQKVIVVMTDGANTYSVSSNHNKSWYAAHGYTASNRLGTSHSSSNYVARMNQKTATTCANAKAAGIKIYTIAFRLESDPTTLSLLQSCASEATMAFRAANGEALIAAFERIGNEISKLRVAG